jgi:hypothetical protein
VISGHGVWPAALVYDGPAFESGWGGHLDITVVDSLLGGPMGEEVMGVERLSKVLRLRETKIEMRRVHVVGEQWLVVRRGCVRGSTLQAVPADTDRWFRSRADMAE